MSLNNKRTIVIETSSVLKILGLLLFLFVCYLIRDILALVFVALFLAALMHPISRAVERYRIPRGVTVIGLYVLLFSLTVLVVGLLLPPLVDQARHVVTSIGSSWGSLSSTVQDVQSFTTRYGLENNVEAGVKSVQDQVSRAATGLFSTITDFFGGIIGFLIILVLAFYMVVQEEQAREAFRYIIPKDYQDIVTQILKRVEEKISRWFLAQLSLGLIIAVLYGIGLSLIGVPSALVLAVAAGFLEFIPYLGPLLAGIPILILAFTDDPIKAAIAFLLIILIQQFENHVIIPKVMQKVVGVNPLISIIALLIGARLFGFIGVLLAIPFAATASVVITEWIRFRRTGNARELA